MTALEPLIDRLLPDYRVRHIFTMKLRIAAFIGFWAIYLYFLRDVLPQTKVVAAVVLSCFLLTGVAYSNVMRGRFLAASFALELFCDLCAISAVLYLTGGPHSPYYTIFLFYALVAGIIYNHLLAAVTALAAASFYAVFLLLCYHGVIPPLILDYGDNLPIPTYTPLAHFFFASFFLGGIVYTVKVASFFSQKREKTLERRNRELVALQRMSSTVRSATSLREVIDRLLASILDGLNFETAAIILFDSQSGKATIYVPERTRRLEEIENVLGRSLSGISISLSSFSPLVMQDIRKHRVIFRRRLSELVEGLGAFMTAGQCDRIQDIVGARRIVVMPIVADREALGALIGFSAEPYVEEEQVSTLEAFADQSALSIEAAALIERLRRLNERLAEANRVKSEFLATMSHELRTPLTAIIGFSELLMEGVMGELTEEQKESMTEVLHNAADLLELINSLLDLTKIESGKMRLEIRSFDLAETFRRVLSTISPLVKKKMQNLLTEIPCEMPPLAADERKVQQLLLNLMANANKFTPEGGSIKVAVRVYASWKDICEVAPWVEKLRDAAEDFVSGAFEITVQDDGMGIAPDHLDRIFEMFTQVDSSATRSFGGTGVGLALARKFVEMHRGRIWVESEWGKGARFFVVMPAGGSAVA